MNNKKLIAVSVVIFVMGMLTIVLTGTCCTASMGNSHIKVGILHSLTGTMAISERSVAAATQLAVDEINSDGGVLGRNIETVLRDGASDWAIFARQAESLIVEEKVAVVFGCWTSASRKTVRPIFEKYNHLLFYPVQYEGLESSPNIIYTGAAPNQQIIPAVKWAMDKLGKRFFLVGSDYVFPQSANAIMKDQIRSLQGVVTGEYYIQLGSTQVEAAIQAIVRSHPDVILNTLNGDSNVSFFKALRAQGITSKTIPTISFSIAEAELKAMNNYQFAGDYAAWNYFQSLPGEVNRHFVEAYKARYGVNEVVTDPMEAAYIGVHLWAMAVARAGTISSKEVRLTLKGLSYAAPEGAVSVDSESQHLWKTVRIGKILPNGQFEVVWDTGKPVRPLPYPFYRSHEEWQTFLDGLYQRWHGSWANLGDTQ